MPFRPTVAALLLAIGLGNVVPAHASPGPLPAALAAGTPNTPVGALDLERYAGRWHEVARLPMFFQRKCVADTTATYTLHADGVLEVRNACRTEDGRIESVGAARTTDIAGALEVRFAPAWLGWLPVIWADYWVVDLDPEYEWAVVGGPKRSAMWILAREPSIDPALFERIRQRAEARGYRLDTLIVDPAQQARFGGG